MVFIIDEEGVKVSIQKVRQLEQSEGAHDHPSMLNVKSSMKGENVVLMYDAKMPDGLMEMNTSRLTHVSPVGFTLEYTGSPFAGSMFMLYYMPKGDKIGVTQVGEVKSPRLTDAQAKVMMLKGLELGFNEDRENLKKL